MNRQELSKTPESAQAEGPFQIVAVTLADQKGASLVLMHSAHFR